MKDKLVKKRPTVDWYSLRLSLGDRSVDEYYWMLLGKRSDFNRKKHIFVKRHPYNKFSYLALLHVYGKKKLDEYRYTGEWSL